MKIKEWEARDIERVVPLFNTPRQAKRLVNLYMLLKAGLLLEELEAFEGTPQAPGQYRSALVMLD